MRLNFAKINIHNAKNIFNPLKNKKATTLVNLLCIRLNLPGYLGLFCFKYNSAVLKYPPVPGFFLRERIKTTAGTGFY